jgi:hypothetical protein
MEDGSNGRVEDKRQLFRRFSNWIKVTEDWIIPFEYIDGASDYEVKASEKVVNTLTARARAGEIGQVSAVAPPEPMFSPLALV